jgi:hypothetical protein
MVAALIAVAIGLFFIGIVLCALGYVTVKALAVIWDDLSPLLHHEMCMRRMEVRLMIDDAGYQCPDWLNDDDEEEEEEEDKKKKVIRLVPKQDSSE